MSLKKEKKFKSPEYWPAVVLLLISCDVVSVNLAYLGALWLRFGRVWWQIPEVYLRSWKQFAPLYTALCLAAFAFVGLYSARLYFGRLWRLLWLSTASLMTSVAHAVLIAAFWRRMPASYMAGGTVLQFLSVAGVRVVIWLVLYLCERRAGEAKRREIRESDGDDDW